MERTLHLKNNIEPLLEKADKAIVLDCKDLQFISSSGLSNSLAADQDGFCVIHDELCPLLKVIRRAAEYLEHAYQAVDAGT